jgi:3-methyl-2-oxobutanoate hydroxymethyltransferase
MSMALTTKTVNVPWIRSQKGKEKITMLTAYDYPTAFLLDHAGIDMILVGDSVGTVMYGEPNTLSVTMEDMIRHTKAVSRATQKALVVADLPFMSYQVSTEQAITNAGRLVKEAGAQAVKLEGGLEVTHTVQAITRAGIPVVAHIGLTPQSINAIGSYRMHGKTDAERTYLLESATQLEKSGAFAIVLECIEESLANQITVTTTIPTIGIGSGSRCDGQVLVTNDLVGFTIGKVPRFVTPTASLREVFHDAIEQYVKRTKTTTDKAVIKDISNVSSH